MKISLVSSEGEVGALRFNCDYYGRYELFFDARSVWVEGGGRVARKCGDAELSEEEQYCEGGAKANG